MTDNVSIVNCNTSLNISHVIDKGEESLEEGEIRDDSSAIAENSDSSTHEIHSSRNTGSGQTTKSSRQPRKSRSPVPFAFGRIDSPPCGAEVYSEPTQDIIEHRREKDSRTTSTPARIKSIVVQPASHAAKPSVLSSADHGLPQVTSKHADSHKKPSRKRRGSARQSKRRRASEKQARRVSPISRRDSRSVSEPSDIESQLQKIRARPGINKFDFRARTKKQTASTSFVSPATETPPTYDKKKNVPLAIKEGSKRSSTSSVEEIEILQMKNNILIDLTTEDKKPSEVSSKSVPKKTSESDEEISLDKEERNLRIIALESSLRARYENKKKLPAVPNVTSALSKCDQAEAGVSLVDLTDDEKDQRAASAAVLSPETEKSIVEQNKVENSGVLPAAAAKRASDSTENTNSSDVEEDEDILRAHLLMSMSKKLMEISATSPSVSDHQSVSTISTSGEKHKYFDADISPPLNSLKNVASRSSSSSSSLSPSGMLDKKVADSRPATPLAGPMLSLTKQLHNVTPRTLPTTLNPYKVSKTGNKIIRMDLFKRKEFLMQTSKNLKKKGKDILGPTLIPSMPELSKITVPVTSDALPGVARQQVNSSNRLVICLGEDSDSDSDYSDSEEGAPLDQKLLPTEKSPSSDIAQSVNQFLKQVRQAYEQGQTSCSDFLGVDSSVSLDMDVTQQIPAKIVKSPAVAKKCPNKIANVTKVVTSNSPSLSPSVDGTHKKTIPMKRVAFKSPGAKPRVRAPAALRHLPSSQQREYCRLKLEIARREKLKKLKSRLGVKLASEKSKLDITVSTQGTAAELVRTVGPAPVSVLTPKQPGETRSALEATEQSQTSGEKVATDSIVGPVFDTPTLQSCVEAPTPAAGVKRKGPAFTPARSKKARSRHTEAPAMPLEESPTQEKHDRLSSAEKELVAERRQMLGQLSLLVSLLGDVKRGREQARASEARVESLRHELARSEERAKEDRAAVKKLFTQVGQVRSEVAQTHTRCSTLSKSCRALGQSTRGAVYRVPQEGCEMLRSHMQLVVSLKNSIGLSQRTALDKSSASSETSSPKVPVSKLSVGQAGPVIQLSESQPSAGSSSTARDPTPFSSQLHHLTDLPSDQITSDHQPDRQNSVDESESSMVDLAPSPPLAQGSKTLPSSWPCSSVPSAPLSVDLAPSPPPSQAQGEPTPGVPPPSSLLVVLRPYVSPLQHMTGASRSPLDCPRYPATEEKALDPHKMLCPFALAGKCLDDECKFQHLCSFNL